MGSQEVREQDLVIQERERLYVQLKNIIARQPGPEVAQQLAVYGENLKEKTSQMRRMAKELQSYHTQVKDLQDEVDRYNKDFRVLSRVISEPFVNSGKDWPPQCSWQSTPPPASRSVSMAMWICFELCGFPFRSPLHFCCPLGTWKLDVGSEIRRLTKK